MARKRRPDYLVIALALAVALFLALTNPGPTQFRDWMEYQSSSSAKGGTSGVVGQVFGALGKAAGSLRSNAYARTNLGLLSVYRSVDGEGRVRSSYLGLARTFVKLK